MSKSTIKIMFLATAFCIGMAGNSMANIVHDEFIGCVTEKKAAQRCKTKCGEAHTHNMGISTQKNIKKCPVTEDITPEKPMACFCTYREED